MAVKSYNSLNSLPQQMLFSRSWDTDKNKESYPEPCEKCDRCDWYVECEKVWRKDDHLKFVAGISKSQRVELADQNCETLDALASLPVPLPFSPKRGNSESFERVVSQAKLQKKQRPKQHSKTAYDSNHT